MQRAKTIVSTGVKLLRSINGVRVYQLTEHSKHLLQFQRGLSTYSVKMSYSHVEKGATNSLDYRVFMRNSAGQIVSPFHDIPLYHDEDNQIFNMVVEIPRWSNAKMEICKDEKYNPIKQDVKKGKLRFVKNVFPHHGYIWNYGALPQTWEDPDHEEPLTDGTKGDSDPLDVCEIGHKVHKRGTVIQVKVLGVMCLIDEGETDWKIIVIDVTDPLADQLKDIDDVEKHMPGFLKATEEWFRIYKIPDGKPENKFAFEGKAKDRQFALRVIKETYEQWKGLISKAKDNCGIACENTCVKNSPYLTSSDEAKNHVDGTPGFVCGSPLDSDVDKWHYVKL